MTNRTLTVYDSESDFSIAGSAWQSSFSRIVFGGLTAWRFEATLSSGATRCKECLLRGRRAWVRLSQVIDLTNARQDWRDPGCYMTGEGSRRGKGHWSSWYVTDDAFV